MSWWYKGEILQDHMIPDKTVGFIYLLTYTTTGQRYLGRKLLTKAHRRQKNKKIIRTRVESDWREYWSSSPDVKQLIEEVGTDKFVREILVFALNKSHLMYLEEKFLYCVSAMESEHWLNSNIRAKVFKRNILNKFDTDAVNSVLHSIIHNQ
jgi:hypothetical protein